MVYGLKIKPLIDVHAVHGKRWGGDGWGWGGTKKTTPAAENEEVRTSDDLFID